MLGKITDLGEAAKKTGRPWPLSTSCFNTTWRRISWNLKFQDGHILSMDADMRCEIKTTVCRHAVSNAMQAQALVERIGTCAQRYDYRALVVIETSNIDESNQWRQWIADHFGDITVLDDTLDRDRSDELTRFLGLEQEVAVYAREFDSGLFAALAGTIKRGGVLFWISRSLNEWAASSRFANRVVCLTDELNEVDPQKQTAGEISGDAEQDDMLDALTQLCAADNGPSVAVIEGRRGRGKSTLLGRLIKTLNDTDTRFLVTASFRGALRSVIKSANVGELPYVAVDQIQNKTAEVLLVDEAANISIDLLKRWVLHFPTVILATTVEGYESAGRSFTIRFAEWLDEQRPGWHLFEPKQAWRWRTGDPLEQFVDQLMLSSDTGQEPVRPQLTDTIELTEVTQDQLASDESLLRSVFSLLREQHYQTSALDLQHLLDAPKLRVFIASVSGYVVGASLVVLEGQLDESLGEDIVARKRRIAHQLLPQLLAQTANQAGAITARYARVLRIAVTPDWRRRGIASQLLRFCEASLSDSIEIIGSSFGDVPIASAFWAHQGYLTIHQGYRANPRSGVPSLAVLKAIDRRFDSLIQKVHRLNHDNHHPTATNSSRVMDDPNLSDAALLKRVALGERQVHDTLAAIRRLAGETKQARAREKAQKLAFPENHRRR